MILFVCNMSYGSIVRRLCYVKYIPVLRYRQEERAALKQLALSAKTMPLIEIVTAKPHSSMKGSFSELYVKDLASIEVSCMIDFPTHLSLSKSTLDNVRDFLLPLKRDRSRVIKMMLALAEVPGAVPVISYDPQAQYVATTLVNEARTLKQQFERLAFRVFAGSSGLLLDELEAVVNKNDIVILDIDTAPHISPALKPIYGRLLSLREKTLCSLVIIRSALSPQLTNIGLVDGQPIADADNSLRDVYAAHGFDAFGDFAGIRKDDLVKGGRISPGVVYYFWDENVYVGYRGRKPDLSEFATHIAPTVAQSRYWHHTSDHHKASCPGCRYIQDVLTGVASGRSQGLWKRISIMHYIYSMEEHL